MSKKEIRARAEEKAREHKARELRDQERWEALRGRLVPVSLAVGAAALFVYTLTLYRTVPPGDSGELMAAAYTWGIPHPPGYPLFALLAKLLSLVPIGSVAARMNYLSALADAAAASLLFLAVARLTRNLWAGICAAGLFSFSPLIWAYAVAAEVFALNNFFVCLLIYLLVLFWETRGSRVALAAAFCLGLGLTNHQILIFYGTVWVAWTLWVGRRELLSPRLLAALAGLFALGFSVYLYLPLAASAKPAVSWGDPSTWSGFLDHLLRRDYGTFRLGAQSIGAESQFARGMYEFGSEALQGTLYVGLLLAVLGFFHGLRQPRLSGLVGAILAAFLFYLITFESLANLAWSNSVFASAHLRFWQQALIPVFFAIGVGVAELSDRAHGQVLASRAIPALVALAVLLQLGLNYREQDHHADRVIDQFARAVLTTLPPNALVVLSGDLEINAVRYLQVCEGLRPDVTVVVRTLLQTRWGSALLRRQLPNVKIPAGLFSPIAGVSGSYGLLEFLDANAGSFKLFMSTTPDGEDSAWTSRYRPWPHGFVDEVLPRRLIPELEPLVRSNLAAFETMDRSLFELPSLTVWERGVVDDYWARQERLGRKFLIYGVEENDHPALLREAARQMERFREISPKLSANFFKNLGYAYVRLSATDPSAAAKMKEAWGRYVDMAGNTTNDADLPAIRKAIGR